MSGAIGFLVSFASTAVLLIALKPALLSAEFWLLALAGVALGVAANFASRKPQR